MKIYAGIVSPVVMFTNVESGAGALGLVLAGPEKRNDNSLLSQLSGGERRESWGIFVGVKMFYYSQVSVTPRDMLQIMIAI